MQKKSVKSKTNKLLIDFTKYVFFTIIAGIRMRWVKDMKYPVWAVVDPNYLSNRTETDMKNDFLWWQSITEASIWSFQRNELLFFYLLSLLWMYNVHSQVLLLTGEAIFQRMKSGVHCNFFCQPLKTYLLALPLFTMLWVKNIFAKFRVWPPRQIAS